MDGLYLVQLRPVYVDPNVGLGPNINKRNSAFLSRNFFGRRESEQVVCVFADEHSEGGS